MKKDCKSNKSGALCFALATIALILGIAELFAASSMTFDDYRKHCDQEEYTEAEQIICSDVSNFGGAIYQEVKLAEIIVLFSTCAILVALGCVSAKRN